MDIDSLEVAGPFAEPHYTVGELAAMWNLSAEFVRQIVQHEPGVSEWVRQNPGRRRYRVLRVPESVAERIYRRALAKARDEALRGKHEKPERLSEPTKWRSYGTK